MPAVPSRAVPLMRDGYSSSTTVLKLAVGGMQPAY